MSIPRPIRTTACAPLSTTHWRVPARIVKAVIFSCKLSSTSGFSLPRFLLTIIHWLSGGQTSAPAVQQSPSHRELSYLNICDFDVALNLHLFTFRFPEQIPSDVDLPIYAYMNVTVMPYFIDKPQYHSPGGLCVGWRHVRCGPRFTDTLQYSNLGILLFWWSTVAVV